MSTYTKGGLRTDLTGTSYPEGLGIQVEPLCSYTINPVSDLSYNAIATASAYPINGKANINLNSVNMYSYNNQNVVQLDIERRLCFALAYNSSIDTNKRYQFYITGYDRRGIRIEDQVDFYCINSQIIGNFTAPAVAGTILPLSAPDTTASGYLGGGVYVGGATTLGGQCTQLSTLKFTPSAALGADVRVTIIADDNYSQRYKEIVTIPANTFNNADPTKKYILSESAPKRIFSITLTDALTGGNIGISVTGPTASTVPITNNILSTAAVIAYSNKSFYKIASIVANPNSIPVTTSANISVGMANQFSFPYYLLAGNSNISELSIKNSINNFIYSSPVPSNTSSQICTIVPGYNFYRNGAPTAISSDARGFVAMSDSLSPIAGSFLYYVYGADDEFNTNLKNQASGQSVPKYTPISTTGVSYSPTQSTLLQAPIGSTDYVFSAPQTMGQRLTQYDVTGVQFPGDTNKLYNDTIFTDVYPN